MGYLDLDMLWPQEWSRPLFKNTTSKNRVKEMMKYLLFYLRARLSTDKFAMITDIWSKFPGNCQICYIAGEK